MSRPIILLCLVFLILAHTAIYRHFMPRRESWQDRPRYPTSRLTRAFRWVLMVLYVVVIADFPLALYVFGVAPPGGLRLAAALAVGLAALALLAWSLASLGENFSDCNDGRLPVARVSHGPYRVVGHPIYVANVLLMVALTLLVLDVVMVAVTVVAAFFYAVSAREETRALRTVVDARRP